MKTIHTRLLAVLPSLKALGRWLALAGLTGLACGLAGAAFTWTVGWSTALRGAHPWLLFCMPLAGLVIVWAYRAAGMENDSGTNQIIASVRGGERPPVRLAPLIFLGSALTHLTGGSAGREGAALQIGAGTATCFNRVFHLEGKSANRMTMCGMSALFAAVFGTPITEIGRAHV